MAQSDATQPSATKGRPTEDAAKGFSVAIAFLVFSGLLLSWPTYYGAPEITLGIAVASALIGTAGLGHELSTAIGKGEMRLFRDLGFGLFLAGGSISLARFFDIVLLNVVLTPLLLIGILGIVSGIYGVLHWLLSGGALKADGRLSLGILVRLIITLIGVLAGLAQIAQALRLL